MSCDSAIGNFQYIMSTYMLYHVKYAKELCQLKIKILLLTPLTHTSISVFLYVIPPVFVVFNYVAKGPKSGFLIM